MKKKASKTLSMLMAFVIFFGNTAFAAPVNVKYNAKQKLVHHVSPVYQEAFYDYGTGLPGDNAKITAESRGNKTNYASIYYADYGSSNFLNTRSTKYGNVSAYVTYTSGKDYLQPDSYAYSTGAVVLELNVVK